MSEEHYPGEADEAATDEASCMEPMTPHALTREQCSLCTANRPRLCDQHYKQGADELLKRVTDAIQDQQTPGGVKATYEQLLELCNQQRQTIVQQAQEIERLTKERIVLKAERDSLREIVNMKNSIADPMGDTVPRSRYDACNRDWLEERSKREEYAKAAKIEIDRLEQQLAAMTAERDAYKAVLQGAEYEQIDRIGTLSVEVAQRIGFAAAHRTKEIIAQLAASQQRVVSLETTLFQSDVVKLRETVATLQATLAERDEAIVGLNRTIDNHG